MTENETKEEATDEVVIRIEGGDGRDITQDMQDAINQFYDRTHRADPQD
jgi:hypothetical protein